MINLRGLGNCDSDPNDPVCQTFYGDTPPVPNVPVPNVAILAYGANQPGTVTTTQSAPGTFTTTTTPGAPWYKTGKGLLILGAIAAGGYYFYTKPKKAAASSPVSGLLGIFGKRRRRRSRRR